MFSRNSYRRYQLLKKYNVPIKVAQGEIDDASYEQALNNIAQAYIQQKVPGLLNHLIGFQLVERSEDDSFAVGVFGFRIGKILAYVPVFFINGNIKGIDIIYIHNIKQFLPLTEETFDYIKKLQTQSVGEPYDLPAGALAGLYPNLMQLKPTALKWASSLPRWLQPFSYYLVLAKSDKDTMDIFSDPDGFRYFREKVKDLLKEASVARRFKEYIEKYPYRAYEFANIYGPEFYTFLKIAGEYVKRYPEELAPRRDDKGSARVTSLDQTEEPAEVEIFVNINDEALHKLSPSEVKTLIQKGYLVRDNRDRHSRVHIISPTEVRNLYSKHTPIKGGVYDVLLADGDTLRAFVLPIVNEIALHDTLSVITTVDTRRNDLRKERNYVVIPLEGKNKKAYIVPNHRLIVTEVPKVKQYDNGDAPESDSIDEDYYKFDAIRTFNPPEDSGLPRIYIVFTKEEATPPVLLNREKRDDYGRQVFYCSLSSEDCTPHRSYKHFDTVIVDPRAKKIGVLKEFVEYRYYNNGFIVPEDARIIELANPDEGETLPTMSTNALFQSICRLADRKLEVVKTGSYEFAVDNKPLLLDDLLKYLIVDLKMSQTDAEEIIKRANDEGRVTVLIKSAVEPPDKTPRPPGSVALPAALGNVGQLGNLELRTINEGMTMAEQDINRTYPHFTDPLEPGSLLDQKIREAIASGKKNVLDTKLFTELLVAEDDRDVIEKYLPDIMKGLNGLGYIMMNLYMHYDTFKDRYGEDELPSIEQNLRQVFKKLGQLVLQLERRPIAAQNVDYLKTLGLRG